MFNSDQDLSMIIGFHLPTKNYCWSEWDCFSLADYIFFQFNGYRLPNISWVYKTYTEETQPKDLVLQIVKNYCQKTDQFVTGNLVVLEINNIHNLGTVYKNSIIYMGTNTATWQPIERMGQYLNSIWVYDPFDNVKSRCKSTK